MSFIVGKITRNVSKQHKEYFVGKVCNIPVRAFWIKKKQDDLCLFLDKEKVDFLSERNEKAGKTEAQEEDKQPQL